MTDYGLYRQLSIVDWDFIDRNSLDLTTIHWYPGSFAPGLPGVLVDLLSDPKSYVFDPFCGVGSTAVAALLRGRDSLSCDISLVGLMSSFAMTGLISLLLTDPRLFDYVFDDLEALTSFADQQSAFIKPALRVSSSVDNHISLYGGASFSNILPHLSKEPVIESLLEWYHPKTLDNLVRLGAAFNELPGSRFTKIVGATMISAIARATCSETRSWGHIADNVRPKELRYKDVRLNAISWLRRTRKQISSVRYMVRENSRISSFEFCLVDWRNNNSMQLARTPSLLLTSPPYGGAIDYGLAQRLSLYLLGFTNDELTQIVNAEIGARRKRFRSGHVATWAEEMVSALERQIRFLGAAGYAALVLPHKDHGRDVGEILLKERLAQLGWELWFASDRSVRQSRTRQSWTSIKKETILIFRKKGP